MTWRNVFSESLNFGGVGKVTVTLIFAGLVLVQIDEASAQSKNLISAEGLAPKLSITCILEDEGQSRVGSSCTMVDRVEPIDFFATQQELTGTPCTAEQLRVGPASTEYRLSLRVSSAESNRIGDFYGLGFGVRLDEYQNGQFARTIVGTSFPSYLRFGRHSSITSLLPPPFTPNGSALWCDLVIDGFS